MNKKLITIIVVTSLIFLGMATGTSAKINLNEFVKSKSALAEREIFLGTGYIYGDGIEENSICDAVTVKDLIIKISADTEVVDFYMTYDIQCNGSFDEGHVYLFIMINDVEIGNQSETIEGIETGEIRFADVTLTKGDVIIYGIGVVYSNYNPWFFDLDGDVGVAYVLKPRTIQNRLIQSPFFQFMLKLPLVARLLSLRPIK